MESGIVEKDALMEAPSIVENVIYPFITHILCVYWIFHILIELFIIPFCIENV